MTQHLKRLMLDNLTPGLALEGLAIIDAVSRSCNALEACAVDALSPSGR